MTPRQIWALRMTASRVRQEGAAATVLQSAIKLLIDQNPWPRAVHSTNRLAPACCLQHPAPSGSAQTTAKWATAATSTGRPRQRAAAASD